jgi:hypothetical protein
MALSTALGAQAAFAQVTGKNPCSELEGVHEEAPVIFRYNTHNHPFQRAFLPHPGHRNSWVEAVYGDGGVRLENELPALGLAFNAYYVRLDVVDLNHQLVPALSGEWPSDGECSPLALFPGQKSLLMKLPEPTGETKNLRLIIRVWSSDI